MTTALREPRVSNAEPPARRRRWRWLAAAVVVVVLVGVLTWIVAFSSILGVSTVRIRGSHTLTGDQVRTASGIELGDPLVRLDTGSIEQRIERLPDIASAHVMVSYPSTVLITVRERVPVGYLTLSRGAVLVDVTGRQFRSVTSAPAGLPRFDVPPGAVGEASARAVAQVAGALPTALRRSLTSIQAVDPSSVTLDLADHRIVRWGSADRSDIKGRVLTALLTQPGSVFDVSDADLAVVR